MKRDKPTRSDSIGTTIVGRACGLLPALAAVALLGLGACSGSQDNENPDPDGIASKYEETGGSLLGGDGGIQVLGNRNERPEDSGGSGIGVNSFLWRASLDTISFMPLASADPFGGVIITDWYSPPESPDERFKLNIYILGRDLRADGVRAAVFRQRHDGARWVDAAVDSKTGFELENAILTRARQLRIAQAG
ncbi:MAG: DUF3576 domain-containing protein [Kiloniellales bacterium]